MPLYEVNHVCPLTDAQKQGLATAITSLHSSHFRSPRLFVNVYLHDASQDVRFCGGDRRKTNSIIANVRSGSRTVESFHELIQNLIQIWQDVVNDGKLASGITELRKVSIHPSIIAGWEAGYVVPEAGKGFEWMIQNQTRFEQLAAAGDEDATSLREDLEKFQAEQNA